MKVSQKRIDRALRGEGHGWQTWVTVICVLAVLCGLFYYVYYRQANTDYEGRIVDRWVVYSQGRNTSPNLFRIRVESDDGKQFVVNVDSTVYESARVGMRIKNRSGQIVLIESERNQPTAK